MEPERYVIDPAVQPGYVGSRDARTFLPFLLPHLRPGLHILDAGCGVGAIALDLAATVEPGRIVGIDVDDEQVKAARKTAQQRGLAAEFEVGTAYELPFDDATFDVVYSNAVLLYLREPVKALAEMRRVLRPGGVAAVSDDDISTIVFSPADAGLDLAPGLFAKAVAHQGGNTSYSRHLRRLMLEAGFARTQGHALTPEVYGDAKATRWMADFAIGLFGAPTMAELIVDEGWASREELERLLRSLDTWAELPDAFLTWLYCAALGWVD